MKSKPCSIKGLLGTPRPFQVEGVAFLNEHDGRGLIADEMGLGKTLQAIAWIISNINTLPGIIVCPSSLKFNWESEIHKWAKRPPHVVVLSGMTARSLSKQSKNTLYIVNYDIIVDWALALVNTKPRSIVIDECHYLRNFSSLRTEGTRYVAKVCPHLIALSGTPITNRPREFFSILNMLAPKQFSSRFQFSMRYCQLTVRHGRLDDSGASNTEELHKRLTNGLMIRRLKKNVLPDLPAKIRSIVPLEITNRKEYDQAEHNFIDWVRHVDHKDPSIKKAIRSKMATLKLLALKGKLEAATEWIATFLDNDEKLVAFSFHTKVILHLQDRFKQTAVRFDGKVNKNVRKHAVERFQQDRRVLLFNGNIVAAAEGITLTAASNTVHVEFMWDPSIHDQAEDRVHRIGQKADSVTAWYLVGIRTIEERVLNLHEEKRKVLRETPDGDAPSNTPVVTSLIKSYIKKGK